MPPRGLGPTTALALALCACAQGSGSGDDAGFTPPIDSAAPPIDAVDPPDAADVDPQPDARPADAAPPPDARVDAAVDAAPDAAVDADPGCTITTVNLLANADFELGAATWVQVSGAPASIGGPFTLIVDEDTNGTYDEVDEYPPGVDAPSGIFGAWMGGYNAGTGFAGVDTLHQDFAVPADATNMQIFGQRFFVSSETGPFDTAKVELRTTGGGLLEVVQSWNSTNTTTVFTPFSFVPAGDYRGQTIRLHVETDMDTTVNTNFFFDSFEVRVTRCL